MDRRRGRRKMPSCTWRVQLRLHHKLPPGITATRAPELSHGGHRRPNRLRHPTLPDFSSTAGKPHMVQETVKPALPPDSALEDRSTQLPAGEALILMSTPAGRLSLLRASIVLLVGWTMS